MLRSYLSVNIFPEKKSKVKHLAVIFRLMFALARNILVFDPTSDTAGR